MWNNTVIIHSFKISQDDIKQQVTQNIIMLQLLFLIAGKILVVYEILPICKFMVRMSMKVRVKDEVIVR